MIDMADTEISAAENDEHSQKDVTCIDQAEDIHAERKTMLAVLQECNCCPRCQLRFQNMRWPPMYSDPKPEVLDSSHSSVTLKGDAEQIDNETSDKSTPVCPLCLGILQDLCKKSFIHELGNQLKSEDFEFKNYALTLSLPLELYIRQHLFLIYIKTKKVTINRSDVVDIKDVYKWVCGPLMASELKVPFKLYSPFEVQMTFQNAETEAEVEELLAGPPPKKKKRRFYKPKPLKKEPATKQQVINKLKEKSNEELKEMFSIPPTSPTLCSVCKVEGIHQSIFVAGRYNKYSRSLSQTPWILDGTRMTPSSVQELVCDSMKEMFRASAYNFVASGREDVDVKTLGRGRPFAVELNSPRRTVFTDEDMKSLQEKINSMTTSIAVRDLQIVTREDTSKLKEGEQEKTKDYSALIWLADEVTQEMLDSFSKIEKLTVQQKTPIRVLHRRPLATREKIIHSMSASPVDSHHFKLHLCTQAGTYIKEFVHGDFGRTQPNVSSLLKTEADILTLDVEAVNLDWPKALDT